MGDLLDAPATLEPRPAESSLHPLAAWIYWARDSSPLKTSCIHSWNCFFRRISNLFNTPVLSGSMLSSIGSYRMLPTFFAQLHQGPWIVLINATYLLYLRILFGDIELIDTYGIYLECPGFTGEAQMSQGLPQVFGYGELLAIKKDQIRGYRVSPGVRKRLIGQTFV